MFKFKFKCLVCLRGGGGGGVGGGVKGGVRRGVRGGVFNML